jgi:cyclophilin family peptidyl-prolyl cis-trans isomerase
MALVIAQLKNEFPDDFRFVYRHFPLVSIHDKALLGTQAAEAAGLQDMFWEMYNYLYQYQSTWSALSVEEFESWLVNTAAPLVGLDESQFETDLTSEEIVTFANETWEFGQELGFPGTPFMVLNGGPYQGPLDSASIRTILSLLDLEEIQFSECPPMTVDPLKKYMATIQMESGDIVLELFPDVAPLTVNSFVFLAENGWFDGVTFHRVLPGFVAQSGDPTGTGIGGPGYAFKNETTPELVFDRKGLLAMANSGPDTNGSQFFITYGPVDNLNGSYTIFGEVIEGMDVVEDITPRDPSQGADLPPGDQIITIIIEEQ